MRENCFYVLHSSGQLLSHKRKHERMDSEQAYRRFKMAQKVQLLSSIGAASDSNELSQTLSPPPASAAQLLNQTASSIGESPEPSSGLPFSASNCSSPLLDYNKAVASMLLPTDLSVSFPGRGDPMKLQATNAAKSLDLSSLFYGGAAGNASNTVLPMEILQQFQYQKQLLLQQQQTLQQSIAVKEEMVDDESGNMDGDCIEAGIPKNVIQNLDFSERHPSVDDVEQMIRAFFTTSCSRQQRSKAARGSDGRNEYDNKMDIEQNEPLNLNLKCESVQRPSQKVSTSQPRIIDCSLPNSHHLAGQTHLHCLVQGCDAVLPRVLADISEHVRAHQLRSSNMHNLNHTDNDIVAPLPTGNDNIINDPKLLQITSIDGFFNRKRGRPPKNRVVEVYNNVSILCRKIFTAKSATKSIKSALQLTKIKKTLIIHRSCNSASNRRPFSQVLNLKKMIRTRYTSKHLPKHPPPTV